jgi:hypothetical protein
MKKIAAQMVGGFKCSLLLAAVRGAAQESVRLFDYKIVAEGLVVANRPR